MTRAVVATLPEKGHLYPLLGPAAALEALGLKVSFLVPRDVRAELARAGFPRLIVPEGVDGAADKNRGAAFCEMLRHPDQLRKWIEDLLVAKVAEEVPKLRAALWQANPSVVVVDPMYYAAAIAADLEEVPWVGWSTSLNPVIPDGVNSELIATTRAVEHARQALFNSFGLQARFRVSDVLSPLGTAVFATEELVGKAPDGVHLVGPSLPSRSRGEQVTEMHLPDDDRPILYASFGSQAWHQPDRYETLFEAVESMDVVLVAAMGDLAGKIGTPENVESVRFAPQLDLLASARVAISHGGANSVMEALAHGVPMLLSPICNDQPHNVDYVVGKGAGVRIDLDSASPAEVRAALERLLADGPERAAARRIGESYRAHNGSDGAARLAFEARQ